MGHGGPEKSQAAKKGPRAVGGDIWGEKRWSVGL